MSELASKYRELAYIHRFHADRVRSPSRLAAYTKLAASCDQLAGEVDRRERLGEHVESLQRGLVMLTELREHLARPARGPDAIGAILKSVMALHGADFGNVQALDRASGTLKIVAQCNFKDDFLAFFREVDARDDSACGRALRNGTQIVIEDVTVEPSFSPFREIARSAGYRSVQSTPIFGHTGEVVGMISTHFAKAGARSVHELKLAELCAIHTGYQMSRPSAFD